MVGAEEFYYLNNFNDYVEQYNKKKNTSHWTYSQLWYTLLFYMKVVDWLLTTAIIN